ncbi:excalibur calcium-binding domain-containing protein [Corynebacterium ulcerans]|nr:excalibur calcium-binding domain-containing protein [Corynebacterium ulcerans]NON16004.1 excalibur calcium-binding domain-containing protein [Corynebacterium ulcerans]
MEDPSSSRFPTLLPPQTAKKYHSKGKNMKVVASLIAITLGMFIILLGIFGAIAESNFRFFVAFLLISLMPLLPGVWTLLHQRREKKGAEPLKRHWGKVTLASFIAFILGSALMPTTEASSDKTAPTTSTASTSSRVSPTSSAASSTTSKTTPTSTSEWTSTARSTSKKPSATPKLPSSTEPAPQQFMAPPPPPAPMPTSTPTPVPAQAPQQFVAPPPAPAPAQDVYFSSCKEARAAGYSHMRRGEPGYRSGLDGDNDGIACDKKK